MREVRLSDPTYGILRDPQGNPYRISQDGTFWRDRASGGGAVAFEEHEYYALVREEEELGLLGDCPAPVLVRRDGSEVTPPVPPAN